LTFSLPLLSLPNVPVLHTYHSFFGGRVFRLHMWNRTWTIYLSKSGLFHLTSWSPFFSCKWHNFMIFFTAEKYSIVYIHLFKKYYNFKNFIFYMSTLLWIQLSMIKFKACWLFPLGVGKNQRKLIYFEHIR
jgi:hypothetical protein